MTEKIKYHDLIVYTVIYFFFNGFMLPHGLLFTTILTPVMIYYLYRENKLKALIMWIMFIIIPIPFQMLGGVELGSYLLSGVMIITVLILLLTAYYLMKDNEGVMDNIFRKIILINGILVIAAIIILPIPSVRGLLWYDEILTKGLELIPRLKLLTYEASYYSLIMMPVFLYFILKVFYNSEDHPMLLVINIGASLLLSLSFGVIGALLPAVILVVIINWSKIPVSLHRFVVFGTVSIFAILITLFIIWPDNPVFFRITNILEGEDTSAMGRLVYSFMFAKDLITEYGIVFGVGPGQIKILAHDMIVNHYKYHGDIAEIVRIPNSMAEMLAIYGVYGFVLKLGVEIILFIRLKVYNNIYSFILFLFIFIYQFTGSFISNAAEIVTWAMVFGMRFNIFEIRKKISVEQ